MARIFNVTFSARDPLLGIFWSASPVDTSETGFVRPRQAHGIEWFVLSDPEGNEFCVGGEPSSG